MISKNTTKINQNDSYDFSSTVQTTITQQNLCKKINLAHFKGDVI